MFGTCIWCHSFISNNSSWGFRWLWEPLKVLLSLVHGAEKLSGAAGLRYAKLCWEEESRPQASPIELWHNVLLLRPLIEDLGTVVLHNLDECASVVEFPYPPSFSDDEVLGLVLVQAKDHWARRLPHGLRGSGVLYRAWVEMEVLLCPITHRED